VVWSPMVLALFDLNQARVRSHPDAAITPTANGVEKSRLERIETGLGNTTTIA